MKILNSLLMKKAASHGCVIIDFIIWTSISAMNDLVDAASSIIGTKFLFTFTDEGFDIQFSIS